MGSSSSPLVIPCGSGLASCTVTFHVHQRAGLKCQMLAKRMSSHHPFNWASGKKGNAAPAILSPEVPVCGIHQGCNLGVCWSLTSDRVSAFFVSIRSRLPMTTRMPGAWSLLSCHSAAQVHGMREVGWYSLLQGGREPGPFLPKSLLHHKRALIMSVFYRMISRLCHLISNILTGN